MQTPNYQHKILALIDQLVHTLNQANVSLDKIQQSIHTLLEYASLDTDPITFEKQSALKVLIEKLHSVEKNHPLDPQDFIKALDKIKSMYS